MANIVFRVNGSIVPSVRFPHVQIHDVLGAQPNTATLTFDEIIVAVGSAIAIGVGDFQPGHLLFAGIVQRFTETYQSDVRKAALIEWPADAIDHTFAANRRRPFQSYINDYASEVAAALIAGWAPGFDWNHLQDVRVPITIHFDGTTPLMECLNQAALAAAARAKFDYSRHLHFYLPPEPGIPTPDPVTNATPPLNAPPITFDVDLSQVRTRVYGRGHGEAIPVQLVANETIVPVADAAFFNPAGGRAIAAITTDGAQTQRWNYTGTHTGVGGTVAGPGQSPTTAPTVVAQPGAGLYLGQYQYAYTHTTANGETLPSPLATVNTSGLTPPAAPSAAVVGGAGLEDGDYTYACTFTTAVGETTLGLAASSVRTSHVDGYYLGTPGTPSVSIDQGALTGYTYNPPIVPGNSVSYVITFTTPYGETTGSNGSAPVIAVTGATGGVKPFLITVPATPTGANGRRLYRYVNGAPGKYIFLSPGGGVNYLDNGMNDSGTGAPPGSNSAYVPGNNYNQVQVSIPIGPSGVTGRNVYRWSPAVPQYKRAVAVANNTATSVVDASPNAGLGPVAPTANTAYVTQVSVSNIAVGPSGVTGRKLYRTAVNAAQLQWLATITNNTTTGYLDTSLDNLLGANAPTADTSGIVITAGTIMPGATSMATAGPLGLSPTGGWARQGQQYIRYTGISGNTLTGIPATGVGAIQVAIPYGTQILPVPALTGVTGNTRGAQAGSNVSIFVQRDDVLAQSALGNFERNPDGTITDGIREHMIVDERRGEASLIAACDAELAAFARPIVGVAYHTRDPKTKAGQIVRIDLRMGANGVFNPAVFHPGVFHTGPTPGRVFGYAGEYLIQEVTITIDPAADPLPRYAVRASSARFNFADLLQRVLMGA